MEVKEWLQGEECGRSLFFFFFFDNKLEVEKILQNELWSFDKHLVVVQYYEKDVLIRELKFERANFLVQVHNLSNL